MPKSGKHHPSNKNSPAAGDPQGLMREISELAGTMLWTTDADGSCTYLSPGWFDYTGQTEEVALGFGWLETVHAEDRERAERIFLEGNEKQETFIIDYRILRADGEYRWVMDKGTPRFDDEGTFLGFAGFVVDVHGRKLAEEERMRYAGTFATLIEQCPLGIYTVDSDFRVRHVSVGALPAFRSVMPVIGRDFAEVMSTLWPERFASEAVRIFRHTLKTGEPYISPGLVELRKDIGSIESYEWQVNRVTLGDGTYGVVCYYFDSTRIQQANTALLESELRLRTLTEVVPAMIWAARPDGHIDFLNQSWLEYTGLSLEEIQGEGWLEVLHPDDVETARELRESALKGTLRYKGECRYRRHDGEYRWHHYQALPLLGEDEQVLAWYGTSVDIHDRVQAEHALVEVDQRKDEFLATLAHELRNPLASIRMGVELLRSVGDDPELLDEVRLTMEDQTRQLVCMVDDLMDVSRITRGTFKLRPKRVDLASIVRSAVETARSQIDAARHKLTVSHPTEPIFLEADSTRLAQVVSNLLLNAARYTPSEGKIELTTEIDEADALLVVKDNGIGISAELQEQIFEMFVQGEKGEARSQCGLGIGLTLVKRLTEMHGGSVSVSSDGDGCGSEFRVRLPFRPSTAPDEVSAEAHDSQVLRRVLVVDDNQPAADMLSRVISGMGHEVSTVYRGDAAIEAVDAAPPEVILMDLGMPTMSGYEAARRIRSTPEGGGVTLIALTGWSQDSDRQKTRDAGFDHHLVKPVEPSELARLLSIT